MFENQPKALYALALANTGERFGYYTMIAVFALFLRANFGLEPGTAGLIYSIFLGLVYFLPLIGGIMADKFGYGKMVTIGIIVMFAGYLFLSVPLGGGTVAFGAMLAALLLSAIMASNTLIAYPIVGRYGLTRHTSSTLSVGASMIALFMALIVMASIVNSFQGEGGIGFWVLFVVKFFVYSIGLILVIPRLTRWFLRRYSDAVMQFIFILAVVFLSAALSDAVGLEGIFGAFLSGLILNRFIPRVSPLMNRIEFTGNALFIPYFLIGVGMLINVRLLFQGTHILWVVFCLVLFGTLGKAVAAYLAAGVFRMPRLAGHMMFGLTSAHAAGAIAMVMVGRRLEISPGVYLFGDEVLNGIVIMILFTCVISTVVTEWAAQRLRLKEKKEPELVKTVNDEKILIPVKYPEYADNLVSMATMMRNPKLKRELVALNVVYDDVNMRHNQAEGQRLLEHLQHLASASDVPMTTQVRIAANIANGIKHAFKEFQASEILMGLHFHHNISKGFWGEFTRSLYNGLSRQIIITRIMQPLNTVRRIQVIVPSRAEFEPGFYRWLERLARMTENLECRIIFHGRKDTLQLINEYIHNNFASVRAEYVPMKHWNELPDLATKVSKDHLFVIVTARKGTISYKSAMERLPDEVNRYFKGKTLMIIFPDQYGNEMDDMTFAQPQHTEERSAYEAVREWIHNKV